MELAIKNKRTGTRKGISIETATLVVTDAILDTSLFNPKSTPGVKVSLSKVADTIREYRVEVIGRRNVGVQHVFDAVLAVLEGDSEAPRRILGVPQS